MAELCAFIGKKAKSVRLNDKRYWTHLSLTDKVRSVTRIKTGLTKNSTRRPAKNVFTTIKLFTRSREITFGSCGIYHKMVKIT